MSHAAASGADLSDGFPFVVLPASNIFGPGALKVALIRA